MAAAVMTGCEPWQAQGTGDRARTGVAVVHGFTGNPLSTTPTAQALNAAGFTVSVPRLPGHGTTARDMAKTRYADWRAEVDRTVDELLTTCDKVVLVGLSMGGTLTLDVTSSRSDVAGAVVINAALLDRDEVVAKLAPILQHIIPMIPRDLAGLPTGDIAKADEDEHAYGMVPAKAAQSLTSQLGRIRGQLGNLTQPILVAWSPQDHTVPPKNSEALLGMLGSDDVTPLRLERSFHVATLDYDRPKLEAAIIAHVEKIHAG